MERDRVIQQQEEQWGLVLFRMGVLVGPRWITCHTSLEERLKKGRRGIRGTYSDKGTLGSG